MRILVVGAGAVGGLFGGLMAAAGRDVTFLLRPERAAAVRAAGLTIVGGPGLPDVDDEQGVTVAVPVLTADELAGAAPFDVVVLATKAYGLESAITDIAPPVRAGAAVLPLLNGMRHVDRLVEEFGSPAVLGGYAFVSSYLDERGRVLAGPVAPSIAYGERDGSMSDRVRAFDAAARDCGFGATASTDVTAGMWAKWVFLAAFAGLNVLSGGSVGEAARAPGGRETAAALLAETASVAQAAGHRPNEGKLARDLQILTDEDSTNRASMDKDRRAGRPVENDAIIGDLVDRADAAGLPVPLLRATRAALGIYVAQRSADGGSGRRGVGS